MEQICNTLSLLCKHSPADIIHTRLHKDSSMHSAVSEGSVRAYVVLSTGKQASERTSKRGRKIPQRLRQTEYIRQRFNVRVFPVSGQFSVKGLDTLLKIKQG